MNNQKWLCGGVALVALAIASSATAQSNQTVEEVVVTGSRIRQNGGDLPTPVTVIGAEQLQSTSPTSIPDALNKLPAFTTAASPNSAVAANGRGFGTPGNFLNLRNLGSIRNLILQDGRRVPGTMFDTTVDTDMLPQLLISRVDVVTGGASAVYGSDAVTGVVNFITDNKFVGLKGVVQGGISKYGDAAHQRVGIANGFNVGERGHFEWSAEYYNRDGIEDHSDRPYGDLGSAIIGNGSAAQPYVTMFNVRQSNASYGGLVVGGPFNGQKFNPDGSLSLFNPGTPTVTANAAIGGDGGTQTEANLTPDHRTSQLFGRFDYDITDTVHGSLSLRYAHAESRNQNQNYTNVSNSYPLFIYSGNAFLTASQQAALDTAGTTSFRLDRFDRDLANKLELETDVGAGALTFELDGKLWSDWTWDGYYSHGDSRTRLTTINNLNSANFYAAADAVRDPSTGNVVCRVTITAPGAFPGCQPLNLLGENRSSQGARDFVFENTEWVARNHLDDFGANITGTLFEGWAGPIKAAVGAEFRHAELNVTTTVPSTTFNPQYLRLGAAGNALPGSYPASNLAYFKEAQAGATGEEDVIEGNVEVNAPVLKDLPFAQLVSVNAGYRKTKYTTEGNQVFKSDFKADTWKVGVEWQVYDDLRIRATRSRDIRAPTLWDLYQQQIISASGVTDPLTGVAATVNTVAGGNPTLQPEKADNTAVGFVYRPNFLAGAYASVDWWKIDIGNAIGGVNGLNPVVQNLCLASPGGNSPYCALVQRPISYNSTAPGNFPTLVYNVSQNIARTYAEGFDFEFGYRTDLEDYGLRGGLAARLLWSHQGVLKTQSLPNVAGQPKVLVTNGAGTGALPKDKFNLLLDYKLDKLSIGLVQKYNSSFAFTTNPTLFSNIPDIKAYYQTDVNVAYDFVAGDRTLTGFVNISNLFNKHPGLVQNSGYTGSLGMNYPVATGGGVDLYGRYLTVGVRFRM